MKKLFIFAAVAALSAGLVFVACKKEITNTDKVATEQVVKHQKTEGVPIVEIPEVFYSSDGITFFDGNGNAVTGIHVEFGELYGRVQTGTDSQGHEHIVSCTPPGNECGDATIWDDVTTMSWSAIYTVRNDGTIIIQPR